MPDQADPTRNAERTARHQPGLTVNGLEELEADLMDVLRTTHPIRLGSALRRMETEASASWPHDEVIAVIERGITLQLRHNSARRDEEPGR